LNEVFRPQVDEGLVTGEGGKVAKREGDALIGISDYVPIEKAFHFNMAPHQMQRFEALVTGESGEVAKRDALSGTILFNYYGPIEKALHLIRPPN